MLGTACTIQRKSKDTLYFWSQVSAGGFRRTDRSVSRRGQRVTVSRRGKREHGGVHLQPIHFLGALPKPVSELLLNGKEHTQIQLPCFAFGFPRSSLSCLPSFLSLPFSFFLRSAFVFYNPFFLVHFCQWCPIVAIAVLYFLISCLKSAHRCAQVRVRNNSETRACSVLLLFQSFISTVVQKALSEVLLNGDDFLCTMCLPKACASSCPSPSS